MGSYTADREEEPSSRTMGGKGANLIELTNRGLPVPEVYIVTARAYRDFVRTTGIESELLKDVDVNIEDVDALEGAADSAQRRILNADIPRDIVDEILEPYSERIGSGFVAVRSSATAEDLMDASFAGQYTTFLNVSGEDEVIDRVKRCWASLFNERAIYYRVQNGIRHDDVDMAVVVQEMVDADKSGVMFTSNPSNDGSEIVIEAGYGLGEAIVSGEISPDRYVFDRESGEISERVVNTQEVMYAKNSDTGKSVRIDVPRRRGETAALSTAEVKALVEIGIQTECHYGTPQDIEWCIADGDVFVVQSRPITAVDETTSEQAQTTAADLQTDGEVLGEGTGVSSGRATGAVVFNPIDAVTLTRNEGTDVILVRTMTSPSDIQGMKAAVGVLTSKGGTTSHAAIVARELEKPTVVGCEGLSIDYDSSRCEIDTTAIEKGDVITIDADTGRVFK